MHAKHIVAGDLDVSGQADLVIDFGVRWGIWTLANSATWARLDRFTSEGIVLANRDGFGRDEIVIDYGSAFGVWEYDPLDQTWMQLHAASPEAMVAGAFH